MNRMTLHCMWKNEEDNTMNMKTMARVIACVVALMMVPACGLAGAADALYFDTPIACERMTVVSVLLTRYADDLAVEITYTLPDTLSASDKEALELMTFHIMPDAESTDYPAGFQSGSIGAIDQRLGAKIVAGETYLETSSWDAWIGFPDTIYLRPYYKLLGEWGEVIALNVAEGKPAPER